MCSCLSPLASSLYHTHTYTHKHCYLYIQHKLSHRHEHLSIALSSPPSLFLHLSPVWRHLWCDNLIRYHPERGRERWVKNKGERMQKIRDGGQGGETVSHHLFCCFSLIFSLLHSNFRLSSHQLPALFSCNIPPRYCLLKKHFHFCLFRC